MLYLSLIFPAILSLFLPFLAIRLIFAREIDAAEATLCPAPACARHNNNPHLEGGHNE